MTGHGSHTRSGGRYRRPSGFTDPGGLSYPGSSGHQSIEHGYVDDPNPALKGKKQKAAINTRTDALETEYARGRLSDEAYRAGRIYQRVLELSGGKPTGGGQWMQGDRVDAASAHEIAIWRSLDTARKAHEMIFSLLPVIGILAANVLRMILLDRLTITEVTSRCEGSTERMQVVFYAETFRRSLQIVADEWAKTAEPR